MSKTYDSRTLRHEEARHAVARLVKRMGFVWNDHHIEAGIDSMIEVTDPSKGTALGAYIGVQVKTVLQFQSETSDEFSYSVTRDDLNYWLGSKLPILLIVGRPQVDEFFAIHVQTYFRDPKNANTKTIRFDKVRNRFTATDGCKRLLLGIADTFTRGLSWPPQEREETLISNLLKVELPKHVYSAPTGFKDRRDLIAKLKTTPAASVREVIIKEDRVWSPVNVGDPLWGEDTVDRSKVEITPFRDLALHRDRSRRRYAVELLILCLNVRLAEEGVYWQRDAEMFAYIPSMVPNERISREVRTEAGTSKQGIAFPTFRGQRLIRCRHAAMAAEFVTVGDEYYLEINPTCFFSSDGRNQHPRHEEFVQRLKIMQKQRDFLRGLFLWRTFLTRAGDMFRPDYPHISFGDFLRLVAGVSIPDDVWLRGGGAGDDVSEQEFDVFIG